MSEQIVEIIKDIAELQSDLVGIGSEEIMDKLGRIKQSSMQLLQKDRQERVLDNLKVDALDQLNRLVELATDSDMFLMSDHQLFILGATAQLFDMKVRKYFEARNRQAVSRALRPLRLEDIPLQ